jgi:hypothetical protein
MKTLNINQKKNRKKENKYYISIPKLGFGSQNSKLSWIKMTIPANALSPLLKMIMLPYETPAIATGEEVLLHQRRFLTHFMGSSNLNFNKQPLLPSSFCFTSIAPYITPSVAVKVSEGKMQITDLIVDRHSQHYTRQYHLDLTGIVNYMHLNIEHSKSATPIISVTKNGVIRGSNARCEGEMMRFPYPQMNTDNHLHFSTRQTDHITTYIQYSAYEFHSKEVLVYYEATDLWEKRSIDARTLNHYAVLLSSAVNERSVEKWFKQTARTILESRIEEESVDTFIEKSLLDPTALLDICNID